MKYICTENEIQEFSSVLLTLKNHNTVALVGHLNPCSDFASGGLEDISQGEANETHKQGWGRSKRSNKGEDEQNT